MHYPMNQLTARRSGALTALALALICLLAAPSARASHSQPTVFDGTGAILSAADAKKQGAVLNQLQDLGVDQVRLVVPWRFLSPARGKSSPPKGFDASDPADYPQSSYAGLDAAVQGIANRGMETLLTPAGPAPTWATAHGSGSGVVDPSPAYFGKFVHSLGRRYSGNFRVRTGKNATPKLPRIRHWSVWNEPNQEIFLRPQYKHGRPYSPTLYRRLYVAARAGLAKAGHGGETILAGETAPSGGRSGVDPIPFMKGVLCLNSSYHRRGGCKPIQASGWAHHPYSPGIAPFLRSPNPGLVSMDNIGSLVSALRRGAAGGGSTTRLPVYITEFGIQSVPDHVFGVSLAKQMGYLAIAEHMSWANPSIRSYSQYLLDDDPPGNPYRFTTGLAMSSGAPKPSLRSFPITLLVKRTNSGVLIWGHVRPGTGSRAVTVTYRQSGRTANLRRLHTNRNGYFSFRSGFAAGRKWAASAKIPGSGTLQGPYQVAYLF